MARRRQNRPWGGTVAELVEWHWRDCIENEDGCVIHDDPDSYSSVSYHSRNYQLHRIALADDISGGDSKKALAIYFNTRYVCRHLCDVKGCINPEHLHFGTHSDNMRDKQYKAFMKPDYVAERREMKRRVLLSPETIMSPATIKLRRETLRAAQIAAIEKRRAFYAEKGIPDPDWHLFKDTYHLVKGE